MMAELIPAPVERILAALRVSVKWLCRPTRKIKPVDSKMAAEMGRALDAVLTIYNAFWTWSQRLKIQRTRLCS